MNKKEFNDLPRDSKFHEAIEMYEDNLDQLEDVAKIHFKKYGFCGTCEGVTFWDDVSYPDRNKYIPEYNCNDMGPEYHVISCDECNTVFNGIDLKKLWSSNETGTYYYTEPSEDLPVKSYEHLKALQAPKAQLPYAIESINEWLDYFELFEEFIQSEISRVKKLRESYQSRVKSKAVASKT